jgi:hypothetical protein
MFTVLVLIASYGVIFFTAFYVAQDSWSGLVSLGNFAAILFSIPFLSVRAWQLRPSRINKSFSPLLWWSTLMFPILYIGLATAAVAFDI